MKSLTNLFNGTLKNRGDKFDARITGTGRQVARANLNNGMNKYSITRYPNGTTVETKTTKF